VNRVDWGGDHSQTDTHRDANIRRLQNPEPPPPLKETRAEGRGMRNDCRQQLGLPVLTFPQ